MKKSASFNFIVLQEKIIYLYIYLYSYAKFQKESPDRNTDIDKSSLNGNKVERYNKRELEKFIACYKHGPLWVFVLRISYLFSLRGVADMLMYMKKSYKCSMFAIVGKYVSQQKVIVVLVHPLKSEWLQLVKIYVESGFACEYVKLFYLNLNLLSRVLFSQNVRYLFL